MSLDALISEAEHLPDFNSYMMHQHKTFAVVCIYIGTENCQNYGDTMVDAFAGCLDKAKAINTKAPTGEQASEGAGARS